jgi:hypothetical protein
MWRGGCGGRWAGRVVATAVRHRVVVIGGVATAQMMINRTLLFLFFSYFYRVNYFQFF